MNRSQLREREDQKFFPVIIKRNDEVRKHPDDVLQKAINEGLEQVQRNAFSLFLSAVIAGLILSFTPLLVAFADALGTGGVKPYFDKLLVALFYPLTFVLCIMSSCQLFTEHTAIATFPFLDRKTTFKKVLRLWTIVLGGNLFGTLIGSYLIFLSNPMLKLGSNFQTIAAHFASHELQTIFISSILAGWLMAQAGWLILSTPPAISQILCVFVTTFVIAIGPFHHSIAGSAELFVNYFLSAEIGIYTILGLILFCALGNLVGGSFFVAILNYGHIRQLNKKNA